MVRYKTKFKIDHFSRTSHISHPEKAELRIVGESLKGDNPYVSILLADKQKSILLLPDKELERIAINILRALDSKHLKIK